MKLASLQIDRFGARRNLSLADFTDELNVIYGPNGAGKTTVIQFIRWMLFGDRDEMAWRYLSTGEGPAAGRVSIRENQGLRTLQRRCQAGSLLSQLTCQGEAAVSPVNISNAEFDRFFVVSFDHARNIADLLSSARLHGVPLYVDGQRREQTQRLRDQIDQYRGELEEYAGLESPEQIRRCRDQKQADLASLRQASMQRQQDLQQERSELASSVADLETRVDRLHNVYANLEQAFISRKQQLTVLRQEWLIERRDSELRRRQKTAEIDRQLSQWQEMLDQVRSSLDSVRSRRDAYSSTRYAAADAHSVQFDLQQLRMRLQDVEHDVERGASWSDHEANAEHLRRLLNSAMDTMRNELSRLGHTVDQQQQLHEFQETREELGYLMHVERELLQFMDELRRQWKALQVDDGDGERSTTVDRETQYVSSSADSAQAFLPSADGAWNEIDDFRLRHLAERRQSAIARLRETELELGAQQRRLQRLDEDLVAMGHSPQFEQIEHDLEALEETLRRHARRRFLDGEIEQLEKQWRQLCEFVGTSYVVQQASDLLRRLTAGEYWNIEISTDHRCRVFRRHEGDRQDAFADVGYDYSQLNRGVQDQVYLALTLAVVDSLDDRGDTAPVILNDVFSNLDHAGSRLLSHVLEDFASRRQVFVFTRHDHIRELFLRSNTRVFELKERESSHTQSTHFTSPGPVTPVYASASASTPPPTPRYQWVAEWQARQPVASSHTEKIKRSNSSSEEPRKYPSLAQTDNESCEGDSPTTESAGARFSQSSSLDEVSLLGEEFVKYVNRLGVHTVAELLELDAEHAAKELAGHGITLDMIQRRQREVMMLVYVGVSTKDAQLLVACGVPDPARLARADEGVLFKRVETVLSRPQTADRFGTIENYGLGKVRQWIQAARNSHFPHRGIRGATRSLQSKELIIPVRKQASPNASAQNTQSDEFSRQDPDLRLQEGLRFYLDLNDQVVDAPSIGPKTAEKLQALGILTVSDLLHSDPEDLAEQMGAKRFTAEVIQKWQLQAELVCSIPNLRGHDAQVLVACGVEDPVTLASLDPSKFLVKVQDFVESKDGQRTLRSAKKPDLAEVTAWIEWADSARPLRAA